MRRGYQKSTKGMSREEWLAERRKSIGGSDAAGIVGLSQWSSPYSVWADKTGRLPDKEDTEAMRQGRDLEEYVAQRWCEATGKKVRRVNAIYKNPDYPFAHANIDRAVIGEEAGLECKTTSSLDLRKFRGVEFPVQYYAQCVHYLAVTGAERWHLAVVVLGRGFYIYTLERDEVEIAALMAAERDFWEHVATDTPPTVDGSDASTDAIETIYAEGGEDGDADLFGFDTRLADMEALEAEKKALDAQITEIKNGIKEQLGDMERGHCGAWRVTWKPQERKTFDAAKFAADHPAVKLDGYYKTTKTRVLKISRAKD